MTQLSPEPTISARRAQTRQRLLDAAVEVFADRGVIAASVEEICEAAGFTRGAFYSNFPDKSALVLTLIQQNMQTQFETARAAIAAMVDAPPQPLEVTVGRTLDAVLSAGRRDAAGVLGDRELLLYAVRDPDLRRPYLEFVTSCREQVAELVSDALAHLDLELVIPLDHAVTALIAVHDHERLTETLQERAGDGAALRSVLLAVTRPRG